MMYEDMGAGTAGRPCEMPDVNPEQPDLVRRYRRHAIDAVRGVAGADDARAKTAGRMSMYELARGMRLVRETLNHH